MALVKSDRCGDHFVVLIGNHTVALSSWVAKVVQIPGWMVVQKVAMCCFVGKTEWSHGRSWAILSHVSRHNWRMVVVGSRSRCSACRTTSRLFV